MLKKLNLKETYKLFKLNNKITKIGNDYAWQPLIFSQFSIIYKWRVGRQFIPH